MPERLIILAVLIAAVALAIIATRTWNARRVHRLMVDNAGGTSGQLWTSLGETPDGRKTLVTFSSPSCAACLTAQAPAVKKVEEQLGSAALRVIKVDAASQPEIASAFGVLTVPSTVVLAPAGRVVAVNQGFASSGKLVGQLQRI